MFINEAPKMHSVRQRLMDFPEIYIALIGGLEYSLFVHILMILPTDRLIFFRGVGLNHQADHFLTAHCLQDRHGYQFSFTVTIILLLAPWHRLRT